MFKQQLANYEQKMEEFLSHLIEEYSTIRAGRANPSVLSKVSVDYYGVPTPISQVANVTVAEARILVIQPWEKNMLKEIEKAILKSDVGITPNNDGKVIRLAFPQLTEERRKELTKKVKKYGEEAKVSIRNIRRDAIDHFKKMEKNSDITEDDLKDAEKEIQDMTDKYTKKVDDAVKDKDEELLSV